MNDTTEALRDALAADRMNHGVLTSPPGWWQRVPPRCLTCGREIATGTQCRECCGTPVRPDGWTSSGVQVG